MQSSKLLNLLKETGALMEGHFLLTSGRHSNIYIEKFRILEDPYSLNEICLFMAKAVNNQKIDLVLGAAIGGILIAGGVGRHLGRKHIFSERVDGQMQLRRGFSIKEGTRVLIVEDIITTGGSVFELIKLVEKCKGQIVKIVNLVDRSLNGINFDYSSNALLNLPSKSWESNDCPLCKKNMPITERGRTGKKVDAI